MHDSQYKHMERAFDAHLPRDRHLDILEVGSGTSPNQVRTHRSLLTEVPHSYLGVDVREGNNIDVVMTKPYTLPVRSRSRDVVISGSVFEHIPFFWASMLEIARVLRPGGLFFITVPSRGHKHSPIDCWRFYPDGLRAMAAAARLTVVESHIHYPPLTENNRHEYSEIDSKLHYWGDAVAVYRKPERYPLEMSMVRPVVRWWANRSSAQGPLATTPRPRTDCDL